MDIRKLEDKRRADRFVREIAGEPVPTQDSDEFGSGGLTSMQWDWTARHGEVDVEVVLEVDLEGTMTVALFDLPAGGAAPVRRRVGTFAWGTFAPDIRRLIDEQAAELVSFVGAP